MVSPCDCNPIKCPLYEADAPEPPPVEKSAPSPEPMMSSKPVVTPSPVPPIEWAVGVMTCRDRVTSPLLTRTLESLRVGGFDRVRLFADGCRESDVPDSLRSAHEVTCRFPKILLHGNWTLTLLELYVRQPHADRFAIFQDDLVCSRSLRAYLDTLQFPSDGYWNLYTCRGNGLGGGNYQEGTGLTGPFPGAPKGHVGWYPSNQRGWGALALVFDREAATQMMISPHMIDRPRNPIRGWRAVDGGVVDSMRKAGRKELVHAPSLVQHTGRISAMDKSQPSDGRDDDFPRFTWPDGHPVAYSDTFSGEDFDLMSLVPATR